MALDSLPRPDRSTSGTATVQELPDPFAHVMLPEPDAPTRVEVETPWVDPREAPASPVEAVGGFRGGLADACAWAGRTLLQSLRVSVFVFCFYAVFFNLSIVRGSSMSPGIEDGDRILVEPWSYVFGGANRGDVIVLRYPLDPEVDYIKRVIGLPGDRITLADGRVWVNGELLDEPYVASIDTSSYLSVEVQPEHYFVLGDNRPRSSDSREFGQVPEDLVRGRVDLRLWPLSRAGWIQ